MRRLVPAFHDICVRGRVDLSQEQQLKRQKKVIKQAELCGRRWRMMDDAASAAGAINPRGSCADDGEKTVVELHLNCFCTIITTSQPVAARRDFSFFFLCVDG
jgi:hypothetical protein